MILALLLVSGQRRGCTGGLLCLPEAAYKVSEIVHGGALKRRHGSRHVAGSDDAQQDPAEASQQGTWFLRTSSAKTFRQGEVQVDVGPEQQFHRILAVEFRISEIEVIEVRPRKSLTLRSTAVYGEAWQHERRDGECEAFVTGEDTDRNPTARGSCLDATHPEDGH